MKNAITITIALAATLAGPVANAAPAPVQQDAGSVQKPSAATLHPADAYDIKQAAEFAVMHQAIKAGEPQPVSSGYEVPVVVSGKTCKVLVKDSTV
jgi:Ni/Co efflux regulator RcnB